MCILDLFTIVTVVWTKSEFSRLCMSESTEGCLGDVSEEGSCQQEVCVLCVHMCVLVIGEFVIE